MTTSTLNSIFATIILVAICSSPAIAQQPAPSTTPQPSPTVHLEANPPLENAVLFVSPAIGGKSFGFFKAADGTAALVPMSGTRNSSALASRAT